MIITVEFDQCDKVVAMQRLREPKTLDDGRVIHEVPVLRTITGAAVLPNVYAVREPFNLDIPQVAPDKWEGATFCTAAILKRPIGNLLHFRAFLRCIVGSDQPRLLFFLGTGNVFDKFERDEPVILENQVEPGGTTPAAPHGILKGGRAILRRVRSHTPDTTPEQRLTICSQCPERIGDPQTACVKIRCCQRKEPAPERWREAVEHSYGMCPLRKWGGDAKAISRIRETTIAVNGQQIQAVY